MIPEEEKVRLSEPEFRAPAECLRAVPETDAKPGDEGEFVDAERDRSMEESKGVEPRDPLQSSFEQCEIDKQTSSTRGELMADSHNSSKPAKRKYAKNDLLAALDSTLPQETSLPKDSDKTVCFSTESFQLPPDLEYASLPLPFGVLSGYGFHLRKSVHSEFSQPFKPSTIIIECTYCSAQPEVHEWNAHTRLSVAEFKKTFSDRHMRSLHLPDCLWNRSGPESRKSEPERNFPFLWREQKVPAFAKQPPDDPLNPSCTNFLFFPLAASTMLSSLQEPAAPEYPWLSECEPRTFEDWSFLYLKSYHKKNGIVQPKRLPDDASSTRPPPQARSAASSRSAHNANLTPIREQDETDSTHGPAVAKNMGSGAGAGVGFQPGPGPVSPAASIAANQRAQAAAAIASSSSRSRRNDFSFPLEKTRRCKLHHFRSGYRYLVQSMAQNGMAPEHNLPPPPIIQNRSQANQQMKVLPVLSARLLHIRHVCLSE